MYSSRKEPFEWNDRTRKNFFDFVDENIKNILSYDEFKWHKEFVKYYEEKFSDANPPTKGNVKKKCGELISMMKTYYKEKRKFLEDENYEMRFLYWADLNEILNASIQNTGANRNHVNNQPNQDVKNMKNSIQQNETVKKSSSTQTNKFKKLFKPLFRGLKHKNKATGTPNNLKENNNSVISSSVSSSSTSSSTTSTSSTLSSIMDDYTAVISKVAHEESFLKSYFETDPFSDEPYPSSETIESCTGYFQDCGYNPEQNRLVVIPVQFARTDAGTFFWTSAQAKIDEDLIGPFLCYTSKQTPQNQCMNINQMIRSSR